MLTHFSSLELPSQDTLIEQERIKINGAIALMGQKVQLARRSWGQKRNEKSD